MKLKTLDKRKDTYKRFTLHLSRVKDRGFAILFAVLIASILLSIGVSIFSLTVKELALSASGRESEYAFYAADSGAECAYYWDTLPAETTSPFENESAAPTAPSCGGSTLTLAQTPGSATSTTFDMTVDATNGYCAAVTVSKGQDSNGNTTTTIDSRGYNICSGSPLAPSYGNQNLVERGLRITY